MLDDGSLAEERLPGRPPAVAVAPRSLPWWSRVWRGRFAVVAEATLFVLVVFALGQALMVSGRVSSVVVSALFQDVHHGDVWAGLGATVAAWAIGLCVVVVVGVPIGLLLGLNSVAYRATQPTPQKLCASNRSLVASVLASYTRRPNGYRFQERALRLRSARALAESDNELRGPPAVMLNGIPIDVSPHGE